MTRRRSLALAFTTLLAGSATAAMASAAPSGVAVSDILQRYADDYAQDPTLTTPHRFGIRVGEAEWTVDARPAADGRPAVAALRHGFPQTPSYFFTMDAATLSRLDQGEINALTAMGKAHESDASPMDIGTMDGFSPGPDFVGEVLGVAFHFWTRGQPERIPIGGGHTRTVHGAQAVVLYYQPGLRSAWVQLRPGQHANADPSERSNPFPSLFIALRGRAKANIGGREIDLDPSEAIFIPPGTPHDFWNPYDEPAEGILLMFGEGA